ncbi:hypothetical protein B0H13DRAFT_1911016 [Mycena leptocephala]|nr:hypothetical protein B0H13DRAFT_1911016 [Mycena leptocephala]
MLPTDLRLIVQLPNLRLRVQLPSEFKAPPLRPFHPSAPSVPGRSLKGAALRTDRIVDVGVKEVQIFPKHTVHVHNPTRINDGETLKAREDWVWNFLRVKLTQYCSDPEKQREVTGPANPRLLSADRSLTDSPIRAGRDLTGAANALALGADCPGQSQVVVFGRRNFNLISINDPNSVLLLCDLGFFNSLREPGLKIFRPHRGLYNLV